MPVILQDRLPFIPWMDPRTARLPGALPVTDDWLHQDEAFAGQMAARDLLIAGQRGAVHAILPQALAAAAELLDLVLANLRSSPGYQIGADAVRRPDGVAVPLDREQPLLTSGRLVQEDLCLMQSQGDEHVLTSAVLSACRTAVLCPAGGQSGGGVLDPHLCGAGRRLAAGRAGRHGGGRALTLHDARQSVRGQRTAQVKLQWTFARSDLTRVTS